MLSPSSPGQRTISEEDSSGSDAGSEAGLEPETDRFGFIVTNGSTAGSVGPPPELVRHREAKWINLITQWERMLLKKTSKVKVQCQKGIPASLRARCWPLLCGASEKMKQNDKLYTSLDSQPALQSWVDVIERDLDRQFPFHEMFLSKDGHGQRGLFRVLKAYTQYQPEDGYCQAQGPVAAVLLMNMPAEEAFWCLVQISEQYLPGYYSPLLEGVLFDAAMLTWVLKRTCPAVHKHLQHHGVEPLMFATDWLMCLFTRHLPFNTLLRVWDLFFCYGVRVLLQVAVVLVRRVLGRAEQRKQCPGQMETLEKLRGVREQVQEEDDVFIAEVCSVQLSVKDLDKRTEKELEKWRKDRPSSTFDPRGRCHGYRMAWLRARQNAEEQNMKEREKGNLSVPLARSASTLSLSPSLLHKRFKKGGKVNPGEGEGGGKIVRHLSMGAKEDWRSWTELNLKKVQGVQEEEDTISEEHKQQSEPKLPEQTEQKELQTTDKSQNTPTEQVGERVEVKEQIEQVETRVPEKEENQVRETEEKTEESKVETEPTQGPVTDQTVENIVLISQHKQAEELDSSSLTQSQDHVASEDQETEVKDTNEKTEIQIEEHEHTAAVEGNQTQMQNANADTNTEVETQESANPSKEQIIQPAMKQEERTETENLQQTQADTVTDVSEVTNETKPDSEDGGEGEASTVKDAAETETQQQEVITETETQQQDAITETKTQQQDAITETETQQQDAITETETQQQEAITETETQQQEAITETETQQQEAITETETQQQDAITETETQQQDAITETDSHEVTAEEKYPGTESLAEESHTQTETETDALAPTQEQVDENADLQDESEAELEKTDSEQHVDSIEAQTLTKCSPECSQPEEGADVRADTETETETPDNNVTETSEALAQTSEHESDAAASELTQEKEEVILTVQSHGLGLQVDHDKTQAEEPLTQTQTNEETTDSVAAPHEEMTSPQPAVVNLTVEPDGKTSSEEPTISEEPAPGQTNIQVSVGAVEEVESKDGEDNVFIYAEPSNSPKTDSHPKIQEKVSDCAKDPTESNNSSVRQTSEHRSSRSSGDFCVRRSSTSRGSRLGRKLSEDLFTMPEKIIQPQSVPDPPEVQPTESQSNPEAVRPNQTPPQSSEVTALSAEVTADAPKRFGLFRRLRGEQPKKAQTKGPAKMQVPKILIQDFSDSTGTAKPAEVEEQGEEKLSSRERRRRRRERERREKEEERVRKKREKELEKERRKPQTRGKSFQVQREKGSSEEAPPAKAGSQTHRRSISYAESYF